MIMSFPAFLLYMNEHLIVSEIRAGGEPDRAETVSWWFAVTSWKLPAGLALLGMVLMFIGG